MEGEMPHRAGERRAFSAEASAPNPRLEVPTEREQWRGDVTLVQTSHPCPHGWCRPGALTCERLCTQAHPRESPAGHWSQGTKATCAHRDRPLRPPEVLDGDSQTPGFPAHCPRALPTSSRRLHGTCRLSKGTVFISWGLLEEAVEWL